MCFPHLFPSGSFGEFHPCELKISSSEYICQVSAAKQGLSFSKRSLVCILSPLAERITAALCRGLQFDEKNSTPKNVCAVVPRQGITYWWIGGSKCVHNISVHSRHWAVLVLEVQWTALHASWMGHSYSVFHIQLCWIYMSLQRFEVT